MSQTQKMPTSQKQTNPLWCSTSENPQDRPSQSMCKPEAVSKNQKQQEKWGGGSKRKWMETDKGNKREDVVRMCV